ncbi:uncharacterized protein BX664DRAFT_322126 [Halteromyces radiatus]|uniref:uncharacterized protein n=1 Tax=Halteromyces radiatus TaxID=101107 RepID=UPI00221F30C2|nr:uncharacterized protein BX664DRAFT_322126 [Halteromyces radiatus]KAI8099792.1 hypothetical protein BX664DRAFT_322126 [Halteromyces radiatus]
MPFADIAKKSMVVLLAGTTVYYMVNIGRLVNERKELKKNNRVEEKNENHIETLHSETDTTPVPLPNQDQPGNMDKTQLTSS